MHPQYVLCKEHLIYVTYFCVFTQEHIPRPEEGWKDPDLDNCIKNPKEEVKHKINTENTKNFDFYGA